jgi:purine-binding chemotaxis protein CheW
MRALREVEPAGALDTDGEEQQQYLTFRLGEETFALSILAVKEIIEYCGVTDVPMMPACVRGVINMRGHVVPVVDLAVHFGRKAIEPGRRTCIVIVEVETDGESHDIGVIVDAVNHVLEIPPEDIEPAPAFGAKLRSDFIAGMGKVEGQFVVILHGDRVLSIEEVAHIGQAVPSEHEVLALT